MRSTSDTSVEGTDLRGNLVMRKGGELACLNRSRLGLEGAYCVVTEVSGAVIEALLFYVMAVLFTDTSVDVIHHFILFQGFGKEEGGSEF